MSLHVQAQKAESVAEFLVSRMGCSKASQVERKVLWEQKMRKQLGGQLEVVWLVSLEESVFDHQTLHLYSQLMRSKMKMVLGLACWGRVKQKQDEVWRKLRGLDWLRRMFC